MPPRRQAQARSHAEGSRRSARSKPTSGIRTIRFPQAWMSRGSAAWWSGAGVSTSLSERRPSCWGTRGPPMGSVTAGTIVGVDAVLVVEDEPVVRDVVVRYLSQAGYRTLEAADGAEAERILGAESPSLVILDVMLPEIDGLDVCRWIRARSGVPIIMLT